MPRFRIAVAPTSCVRNSLREAAYESRGRSMREQREEFDYDRYRRLLAEAVDEKRAVQVIQADAAIECVVTCLAAELIQRGSADHRVISTSPKAGIHAGIRASSHGRGL